MADRRDKLPHLRFVPPASVATDYVSPASFRRPNRPDQNRAIHAALLEKRLEETEQAIRKRVDSAVAAGRPPTAGSYVEFVGQPGYSLELKSIEAQSQKLEVVAVHLDKVQVDGHEEWLERATVFVPHGKLGYFAKKVKEYESELATPRKPGAVANPKNRNLVESIADIRLAVLTSLWTDEPALLPNPGDIAWWEVWLRGEGEEFQRKFAEAVLGDGVEVGETILTFPERTVVLARASREQMALSIEVLDGIAELRLAKLTPHEFLTLGPPELGDWARELAARIVPPAADSPAVCLLDTGVNTGHPLLVHAAANADCQTVKPTWGTDDHSGHGTQMAGLALLGDLTDVLTSRGPVVLRHRLESVKILPRTGENPPELYGAITAQAVARAEVEAPARRRAICMAVTTTDFRDRGQPSSWSAELDSLASGYQDDERRLILVSAGNTDPASRHLYPGSNYTEGVHDPGQSWNAVTVGAYTNKITIKESDARRGWKPLAPAGALSPTSSTAVIWAREWAHKPDIVTEGGNLGVDPFSGKALSMDSLSLLTTSSNFAPPESEAFTAMCETSASVAQAARMAALIQAEYPHLWPETVRALLVHSARWTPAMLAGRRTHQDNLNLLRTCGHGVPSLDRALWSASDALTLIMQDELQPFERKEMKEYKLYTLPWPRKELLGLGATEVTLRVTLSYFVEPNPARRGWRDRHRYASHALRYEVIGGAESEASFRQRINKAEREDKEDRSRIRDTRNWVLGPDLREHGSIHSDVWSGSAADLALRNQIAVFPVVGWWREQLKLGRSDRKARFALVVSLETPPTGVDIYTPVEAQIRVPVAVTTQV
jgi:Subtilase family